MAGPLTDPNNKHNMVQFSSPTSAGGTDQICIFCHIPHSAAPDSTLWSRPEPDTESFPLYAQPLAIKGNLPGKPDADAVAHSKYTNTDSTVTYPNGASRMCLSCHDGVTAIGILRDGTNIAMNMETLSGIYVVDLSTSHPISFVYDTQVLGDILAAKTGYQLPDPNDEVDTPLDGQSRVQCTTCHDPHDDTQSAVHLPFWRQTTTVATSPYDDVCAACHIK